MFNNIKTKIVQSLLSKSEMVVSVTDYVELKQKKYPTTKEVIPLTPAKLTQQQLGSYLPNFNTLNSKTDEYKSQLGAVCKTLINSEHFNYLMDHLKQDQINLYLFGENKPKEDWVRGSINGIYVVADMVHELGIAHQENEKKTLKEDKPKS